MKAGTIHLICGSTGAGKTTYARRLSADGRAVFFSIDAWMAELFWPDRSAPIDPAWALERVERCRRLIWWTAAGVARAGTDVVLEIGLSSKVLRDRFAEAAEEAGLAVKLHLVDAEREERWRRVEARNAAGGELDFPVDRAMFDYVEGMWEVPDEEELARRNGTRVAS